MKSIMMWLLSDDCPVTYDDWADEFIWSCMMRVDGRYSSQKVPDEVGHAISRHHSVHHDSHIHQVQDWCIGVRTMDDMDAPFQPNNMHHFRSLNLETVCSHEVEEDDDLPNDWRVI